MFRKVLMTTSALVVASSMALAAGQHGKLSHAQQVERAKFITRHVIEQHMPGVMFDRKHGVPVAVSLHMSAMKAGTRGKEAEFGGGTGYSTFSKSKNALFLSWFGYLVSRSNTNVNSSYSFCIQSSGSNCLNYEHVHQSSQIALQTSDASPFKHVSTASAISFGAEQYSGTGGARVAIYKDASGVPGTKVAGTGGTFSGLPSLNGLCCAGLTTVTFPPVTLNAKKQYWVVITGNKNTKGRIAWNVEDSDFTGRLSPNAYKFAKHVKYKNSYRTTRAGHTSVNSGSYSSSSGGWIHTSSYTFVNFPAAIAIN